VGLARQSSSKRIRQAAGESTEERSLKAHGDSQDAGKFNRHTHSTCGKNGGVRRRKSEIDELESIADKHYGPVPKGD